MDVVVTLGPGAPWGSNEVRYLLRSIDKHCVDGYDNVYIVGEKPNFFKYGKKIFHIENFSNRKDAKELRIWHQVKKACEDPRVSEEFFLCADDYFFLKDFNMRTFPNYHKGDLKDFSYANLDVDEVRKTSGYAWKSKRTLDTLIKLGLPTFHFDIHCPKRVNKTKFLECYETLKIHIESERTKRNGSLLIKTTYMNYVLSQIPESQWGIEFMKDVKLTDVNKVPDVLIFSSSAEMPEREDFQSFVKANYPRPLSFELSAQEEVSRIRQQFTGGDPKMKNRKVRIQINSRFVDNGQQYGPGKWKVDIATAKRLIESGRAIGDPSLNLAPESIGTIGLPDKNSTESALEPKSDIIEVKLPEDFPFRDKLVSAGYTTLSSLKIPDIEQELMKVPGLGKASVIKIGMALNELC